MQASLVPKEFVLDMWSELLPHFERASEYTFGRFEPEDILDMVLADEAQLWIAFNEEREVKGVTITRFWQYPRKKCLDMMFIGGDDAILWKDPMLKLLQHWAADNGCEAIESSGRTGFARALKDDGYRMLWQVYELPVAETGLGGQNG